MLDTIINIALLIGFLIAGGIVCSAILGTWKPVWNVVIVVCTVIAVVAFFVIGCYPIGVLIYLTFKVAGAL